MSLPKSLSRKEAAEALNVTPYMVDSLRKSGRLGFIPFGGKTIRYPLEAIKTFLEENTVMPCQDHTQGQSSKLTSDETTFTKSTTLTKRGKDANKVRGQQILEKLKGFSKTSSENKTANTVGRVIPANFQS